MSAQLALPLDGVYQRPLTLASSQPQGYCTVWGCPHASTALVGGPETHLRFNVCAEHLPSWLALGWEVRG